jgi:hypothetical protein
MDKTMAYDEPLDPHWERLNELGATVEEIAGDKTAPGYYKHLDQAKANVVPFVTRIARAREMRANIDRAIEDGHLEKFPELDGVAIAFRTFAETAEILGRKRDEDEPAGGVPKNRELLLEIFRRAWVRLRALEGGGFPLTDYVSSAALGDPEIVGTLVITKLPDGTIVSVKNEPLSNEPGVS